MEYKLNEQELKDLMHKTWLKAKNFYNGKTDEYFYDFFESEKKQLSISRVVVSDFCECTYVRHKDTWIREDGKVICCHCHLPKQK